MREFLKLYGVVLLFALPCGSLTLFGGPIDRQLPVVAGMVASQVALTAAACAVLGYAIYRHRRR